MKSTFVVYTDWIDMIEELSDADRGVLLLAMMRYQLGMEIPEMEKGSGPRVAFAQIRKQFEKDDEKYNEICQKRREAGKAGGRPKVEEKEKVSEESKCFSQKASESKAKQNNPDNDNVNDNDNEKQNKKHSCTAEAVELFERLWAEYPVKKGKGQVSDTQKKRLLAIGEPALLKAIERYRAELAKDSGWRRAQNGSTFFNSGYVDYLDGNFVPDKERPAEKKSAGAPNRFHNFEERKDVDYNAMVMGQTLAWLNKEEDAG